MEKISAWSIYWLMWAINLSLLLHQDPNDSFLPVVLLMKLGMQNFVAYIFKFVKMSCYSFYLVTNDLFYTLWEIRGFHIHLKINMHITTGTIKYSNMNIWYIYIYTTCIYHIYILSSCIFSLFMSLLVRHVYCRQLLVSYFIASNQQNVSSSRVKTTSM